MFRNCSGGNLEGRLRILKLEKNGLAKHGCYLGGNVWPFARTNNILDRLQRGRHLLIEEIGGIRFVALVFRVLNSDFIGLLCIILEHVLGKLYDRICLITALLLGWFLLDCWLSIREKVVTIVKLL